MARWRDGAAVAAAAKAGILVHPPVGLRALADSLRSLPPQAATKGDAWRFFTKTAAMPYPVDGAGTSATASCDNATGDVATMLAAVDAALARGCDRIDPLAARTAACRGLGLAWGLAGCDCGWAPHRPLDARWSLRWTELDLVSWLVANDVVVCDAASDAGADTYAYQLLPPAKFAAKTPCVVSPR